MLYNLSQLLREPVGSTRVYRVDSPMTLPYEGEPVVRLSGPLTMTRTPDGILVRADLAGEVALACGRCLQPAAVPLSLVVEEEYLPTVDPITGATLPEPAEPTPFLIDDRHHLDIEEAVRQAAVLEEPMAPLCREDCQGLCPDCGANLNQGPCGCDRRPADSRWAALAAFDAADQRN